MDVAAPGWRQRFHHAAERAATDALAGLSTPPAVPTEAHVESGHPSKVLAARSHHADLVVVGPRGGGGFHGVLLGSVTRQLLHHAACPVVVVRPPAGAE